MIEYKIYLKTINCANNNKNNSLNNIWNKMSLLPYKPARKKLVMTLKRKITFQKHISYEREKNNEIKKIMIAAIQLFKKNFFLYLLKRLKDKKLS